MALIWILLCSFLLILDPAAGILDGQKIGLSDLPFVVHGHCKALAAPFRMGKNYFVFTGMIVNENSILTHCEYCD